MSEVKAFKVERLMSKMTPNGIEISNVIEGGALTGKEDVSGTQSRGGQTVKLSPSDVAAGLAGLDKGPYYFALAKYTEDDAATKELCHYLERVIAKLWQITVPQTKALALLALEHHIWGVLCKRCKGRGSVMNVMKKYRECDRCSGTGQGDMAQNKMASMLNISPQAFYKSWRRRLAIVSSVVSEYDDKVNKHLWQKFS